MAILIVSIQLGMEDNMDTIIASTPRRVEIPETQAIQGLQLLHLIIIMLEVTVALEEMVEPVIQQVLQETREILQLYIQVALVILRKVWRMEETPLVVVVTEAGVEGRIVVEPRGVVVEEVGVLVRQILALMAHGAVMLVI
jgi:hypothetical protein